MYLCDLKGRTERGFEVANSTNWRPACIVLPDWPILTDSPKRMLIGQFVDWASGDNCLGVLVCFSVDKRAVDMTNSTYSATPLFRRCGYLNSYGPTTNIFATPRRIEGILGVGMYIVHSFRATSFSHS